LRASAHSLKFSLTQYLFYSELKDLQFELPDYLAA
jgi:hypothetical protein